MTTTVPALERGLHLLETLAAARQPRTFGWLWHLTGWPKASLARLLTTLRDLGFASEQDGTGWSLGPRAALLTGDVATTRRLQLVAGPLALEAARRTGHSAVVIVVRAQEFEFLAGENVAEGLALQPPGTVQNHLDRGPWGVITFLGLSLDERTQALARMDDPKDFLRELSRHETSLNTRGWVMDDGRLRRGVRRLALPIRDPQGKPVAMIGIGAVAEDLPDASLPTVERALRPIVARAQRDLTPLLL